MQGILQSGLKLEDNSLKQLSLTVQWLVFGTAYYRKDIFTSEILGAYFREGLFLERLIIGILRYFYNIKCTHRQP